MQFPSLVLFLSLLRSTFPSIIIFLLFEGLPLLFLVVWVCLCWIPSAFVYLKKIFVTISSFKDSFARYRILGSLLDSLKYFKDIAPLSYHLHYFWQEIYCHPYLCSTVCNMPLFYSVFKITSLSVVLNCLVMMCFGVIFIIFLELGLVESALKLWVYSFH